MSPMYPTCPVHGDFFVVPLDPDDADERPTAPKMTHRCAACGQQLSSEVVQSCA